MTAETDALIDDDSMDIYDDDVKIVPGMPGELCPGHVSYAKIVPGMPR